MTSVRHIMYSLQQRNKFLLQFLISQPQSLHSFCHCRTTYLDSAIVTTTEIRQTGFLQILNFENMTAGPPGFHLVDRSLVDPPTGEHKPLKYSPQKRKENILGFASTYNISEIDCKQGQSLLEQRN